MMNKFPFAALLLGVSIAGSLSYLQENSAPIVRITSPAKNIKFGWNTLIPYVISVTDNEDGNSEYDEIQDSEVILTVKILQDSLQVESYLERSKENFEVLSWMGQSTCFTCHAAKSKLIGPSFKSIAERYSGKPNAVHYLAKKITEGTTGSWGNQIMPAQTDLEVKKIVKALDWILKHGQKTDYTYLSGTEGVIGTQEKPIGVNGKSVYVLSAHYTDHGIDGKRASAKTGFQYMVLKSE